MAQEIFKNVDSTTVSSGGTGAPAGGTVETWTVASSAGFPAASNSAVPVTQFHVGDPAATSEIILVTNVSGTTWTVTRGAESTTPVTHTAGFTIVQVTSAGFLGSVVQVTGTNTPSQGQIPAATSAGTVSWTNTIAPGGVSSGVSGTATLVLGAPASTTSNILTITDDSANPRTGGAQLIEFFDHNGNVIAALPAAGGWRVFGDKSGAWHDVFTVASQLTPWGAVQTSGGGGASSYSGTGAPPSPTMTTWLGDFTQTAAVGDLYVRTDGTGPGYLYQCTIAGSASARGGTWAQVNPITTLGDLIYGSGASTSARLAGNTSATRNFLTQTGNGAVSAAPAWGTITAGDVPVLNQNTTGTAGNVTGVVAVANGGSGTTTAIAAFNVFSPMTTLGDMIYENSAPSGTRIAGNTTTQKQFLSQTGNGTISAAPAWSVVPGQYLCSPTMYQTGTQSAIAITSGTLTAFDSAHLQSGPFTAPPSGSVTVTAAFVAGNSAAAGWAVGITEHGTTTPVLGFLDVVADSSSGATARPYMMPFVVGGLSPGSSHNFDFVGATTSGGTLTVFVIGQTGTVPTLTSGSRGAPFYMAVQAL